MSSPDRKTQKTRTYVQEFLKQLAIKLEANHVNSVKAKTKAGLIGVKALKDYVNKPESINFVNKLKDRLDEVDERTEAKRIQSLANSISDDVENGNRNILNQLGLNIFFNMGAFPEQTEQSEEEEQPQEEEEEEEEEEIITPKKKKKQKKEKKTKKEKTPKPKPMDSSTDEEEELKKIDEQVMKAQEKKSVSIPETSEEHGGVILKKKEWQLLKEKADDIRDNTGRIRSTLVQDFQKILKTISQQQRVSMPQVESAFEMYKESLKEDQKVSQKFIPEKLIRGKPTTAAGITVQEAEKTRRILEQQAKQIRDEAKKESDELRAELARTRREASEEAEKLREQLREAEGRAILERSTMAEQTEKSKQDILSQSEKSKQDILSQTKKQTDKLSKELKESKSKQAKLLSLVVTANKKLETAKKTESKNRKELISVANKNKNELIKKLKDTQQDTKNIKEQLKQSQQDTKNIKEQLKQAQQERTTFATKAEQTATQLAEQAETSRIQLERQATEQRVMIAQETTRRFNILDKDIKKRLIEKESKKIGNKKIKGISKENVDILINTMPADEKKLYGQSVRDLLSGNINANSMVSGIIGFGGMMATGNPMASMALQSGFNFIRNAVGFDFNTVFSDSNVRQTRSEIQEERKSRETEKTKSFENKLNALIKKQEKEQEITLKKITTKRKQDEKEFQKAIKQQQKEQEKLEEKRERLFRKTLQQGTKLEEQKKKLKEQKSRIEQLLTKPKLILTQTERQQPRTRTATTGTQIQQPILTMTETERQGIQMAPTVPEETVKKIQAMKGRYKKRIDEQKSRIEQLLTRPATATTGTQIQPPTATTGTQIQPPILTMTETERQQPRTRTATTGTQIQKPQLTTSTQNILSIPSIPRIPKRLEIKESERSQPTRKEQKPILTLKQSERSAKLLSSINNIEDIKMSEQKHTAKDLKTVSVAIKKVIATQTGQDEKDIDMEATSDIVEDLSPSFVSRMADAIRSIPTSLRNNAGNLMAVMADAIQSGVGSAMVPLSPIDTSFINSVLDIPEFKTPPTSAQAPITSGLSAALNAALPEQPTPMEAIQERKMKRFDTAFEGVEAKQEIKEVETDSAFEELEDNVRDVLTSEFEDLSPNEIDNYIRTLDESDLRYIERNSLTVDGTSKLSIMVDKQKLLKDIKNVGSSIPRVLNSVVDELKQRYQQAYGQVNALAEGKIIRSAVDYVSEMSAQVLGRVLRAINSREFVSVLTDNYRSLPSISDIHSMTVRDVPPLIAPRSEDVSEGVGAGIVGGAVGSGLATGSAMSAVSGAIPGAIAGAGVNMAIAPALREYYRSRGVNVDDPNIKKQINYYSMIPAAVAGGVVGYSGVGQGALSGAGITEKKIMVDADVLAETQAKEEQEVTKNRQWAPKQIAPTPAILDEPQQEKYAEDLETTLFDYVVPTSEGADGTIMTNQLKKNQFMNQQLRYTDAGVFVPRELWGQIMNTKPETMKKLALGSKPLIPLPEMEFIPADNETTWDNVAKLQFVNKENTSVGLFDPYGDFSDVTNYWTITPDSVLFTENP